MSLSTQYKIIDLPIKLKVCHFDYDFIHKEGNCQYTCNLKVSIFREKENFEKSDCISDKYFIILGYIKPENCKYIF